ncbi:flagellar hook-associated family protein [Sinorhizobium medicae]|uniref:Flagellin n=2 Tax=Sinorhizobium medicae TaxID=110321 RepID=A6U657_SINMW|nr:flagellar hook-associated family protein [Sinorhizobium medicae]ABR59137.1 flagellar hook-associated 3 family protein [Sinorhizobium medicae WSM419]MBO1939192.1 flagellar hook-associated family protein [Sinorhizobium medicae]MBO1963578.1 flagellar hook-associated family protein [Sinorhizobium medicae]MDX0406158.1 flagellar hook-associated family protein [Sinorhizobium medicae]MDX0412926.1 flagellar hook-associated family protein [Sinorhizobium medicae]
MKTSFVSNLAVQNAMRLTIQQGQAELLKLQTEVTTGRHADVGLALGSSTARSVSLQRELARLGTLVDTNSVVTQRLAASQSALAAMAEAAQQVRNTLVTFKGNDAADQLAIQNTEIQSAISAFSSAANLSFNGEFLFAGINTDVRPFNDYSAAGSTAKTTFDNALATYMSANGIASMSDFTKAQMEDFITNTLEPLYASDAQWAADWSDASSQNMTSRISTTEVVQSSANATTEGFRKFALASVIALELMDENVSSEVRAYIGEAALGYVEQANTQITAERSTLGISEARVKKANTSLQAQIKLIKTHITDLEGVDTYEASTRMNTLLTQVETSYTLTSRIQRLSLIDFL